VALSSGSVAARARYQLIGGEKQWRQRNGIIGIAMRAVMKSSGMRVAASARSMAAA